MKKSILLALLLIVMSVSCQKHDNSFLTHWKVASFIYESPEVPKSNLYKDIGFDHTRNPQWKVLSLGYNINGFENFAYEEGYEYIIEVSIVDGDDGCSQKFFNKVISKSKTDTQVSPDDIYLRFGDICY